MYKVVLSGGSPWGFRLEDGAENCGKAGRPVQIAKLSVNSKAQDQGIQIGDTIQSVNGESVTEMSSSDVMQLVRSSGNTLSLELFRGIPASEDSDIYSSGYSSKGSNHYVSSSTVSISSFPNSSGSNLASDNSLSKEDRITRPAPIGREGVKSYRPVLFDVSNGVENTKPEEKFISNAKLSSLVDSDNDVNLRQNLSTSSTFAVKSNDSKSDLDHWNSSKSYSLTSSLPASTSLSTGSNLVSNKTTSLFGNSNSDQLLSGNSSTGASRLPVVQNPTITLLQKKRVDGQIQRSSSTGNELSDEDKFESRFLSRQSRDPTSLDIKNSKNVLHKYQNSDSSISVNWENENFNQSLANGTENKNDQFGVKRDVTPAEKQTKFPKRTSSPEFSTKFQTISQQSVEKSRIQPDHRYTGSAGSGGFDTDNDDARAEKRIMKFEGIGPVDEKSGIPIATRSSLDIRGQKDWYRHMYKSMHLSDQNQESNYVFPGNDESFNKERSRRKSAYETSYTIRKANPDEKYISTPSLADAGIETSKATSPAKPVASKSFALALASSSSTTNRPSISSHESSDTKTGQFGSTKNMEVRSGRLSSVPAFGTGKIGQSSAPSSPRKKTSDSWIVAQYKYENQPYKVQPRSIEDYEPGRSSALLGESEKLFSSYGNLSTGEDSAKLNKRSESRDDSKFRPFWKSMSALDQDSSEKVEKETSRPNVGGNHQTSWKPTANSSLSKDNASSIGLKTKTANLFNHSQPEIIKDGTPRSQSYSFSGTNNGNNRTRQNEPPQKVQNTSRFDSAAVKHNNFSSPEGIRQLRNNNNEPISSAKVLHTFRAQSPTDLSIFEGETVYVFHHIDENWCEGESNGKIGKFPLNFVKLQSISGEEGTSPDVHNLGRAIALYDFSAQTSLELSFRKNEELILIGQINNDWFEGKIGNQTGFIPANFIKILKEPNLPPSSPMKNLSPQKQDNLSPLSKSTNEFSSSSSLNQNSKLWSNATSVRSSFDSAKSVTAKSNNPTSNHLFSNRPGSYGKEPETYGSNPAISKIDKTANGRSSDLGVNPTDHLNSRRSLTNDHPFKPVAKSVNGGEKKGNSHINSASWSPPKSNEFHKSDTSSRFIRGPGKQGSVQTATVWPTYKTSPSRDSFRQDGKFGNSKYVAIYAYKPQKADELELGKGDTVYVMEKYDDGWFVGMSERTRKMGTFPGNYVEARS